MGSLTQLLKRRGRTIPCNRDVADVRIHRRVLAAAAASLVALLALGLTTPVIASERDDDGHWVGTWSASPQVVAAPIQINGQTVRQIVHTSLGGESVRVRFSNAYGTSSLL